MNTASSDFEVIAFFTQANPQPEVSLSVVLTACDVLLILASNVVLIVEILR